MIVVVGGVKGGSGKSTVATNLAILRAKEGRDVLLVDADDQETASDFTQLRNERLEGKGGAGYSSVKLTGHAVRSQVQRLAEKYEDIVIDTGGRDTTSQRAALTVADLLLVPFVPRSFDVWTIEKVAAMVSEMLPANPKLKAFTFLNRADSRGQDNHDAADVLKSSLTSEIEFIDVVVGTRKAFGNAAAEGLAVTELKSPDPKANEEMMSLYRYAFDIDRTSTQNQSDTNEATKAEEVQ
jgi:chromosome partitioning protein